METVVPINDLSRGIRRDSAQIERAVQSVLASGYVVMGPRHDEFQESLSAYLGVKHALGVASGTDALELAMKAVMPPGKSVVLTAANAGGYASVAARRAGFNLRYADVDPESLCLSLQTVAPMISEDVGVVVVTHLYGRLTDMTEIVKYCRTRNIAVVEDCAQAVGARLNGRAAGSFGDVAAISFYPTKNLGAIGDGGAVVTSDSVVAQRIASLRQYGWKSKYEIALAGGVNSRLDELQAAILLVRLPLLDAFNDRRREIVRRYRSAAEGSVLDVLPAEGENHVAHLAVARTSERESVRGMLRDAGVMTDVHFPVPDYAQPGLRIATLSLPVTERAAGEVLSLPCFPELEDAEVDRVCAALAALPMGSRS